MGIGKAKDGKGIVRRSLAKQFTNMSCQKVASLLVTCGRWSKPLYKPLYFAWETRFKTLFFHSASFSAQYGYPESKLCRILYPQSLIEGSTRSADEVSVALLNKHLQSLQPDRTVDHDLQKQSQHGMFKIIQQQPPGNFQSCEEKRYWKS